MIGTAPASTSKDAEEELQVLEDLLATIYGELRKGLPKEAWDESTVPKVVSLAKWNEGSPAPNPPPGTLASPPPAPVAPPQPRGRPLPEIVRQDVHPEPSRVTLGFSVFQYFLSFIAVGLSVGAFWYTWRTLDHFDFAILICVVLVSVAFAVGGLGTFLAERRRGHDPSLTGG
jgi:hypothetical protein